MSTFTNYVEAKNKNLKELSNEEIYYLLLEFVKEAAASKPKNDSKRKVYYISAEFLIGKLLSNNLINLGIYKDVKAELAAAGKSISEIEDIEPEPSLGNGGLGRLAACFIDSMSTLGINGEDLFENTTVVFSNKSSKITNNMLNQITGLKINHGWFQLTSLTMSHSKTSL